MLTAILETGVGENVWLKIMKAPYLIIFVSLVVSEVDT